MGYITYAMSHERAGVKCACMAEFAAAATLCRLACILRLSHIMASALLVNAPTTETGRHVSGHCVWVQDQCAL